MLLNSVHECAVNLAKPVLQDLAEAEQDGRIDATEDELVDKLLQVDGAGWFFARVDPEAAVLANREVAFAPCGDIVQLTGIGGGPPIGWLIDLNLNAVKTLYSQFVLTSCGARRVSLFGVDGTVRLDALPQPAAAGRKT